MAKESAYFTVGGISGKHDVKEIKRGLDTLPGVLSVSVGGGRVTPQERGVTASESSWRKWDIRSWTAKPAAEDGNV